MSIKIGTNGELYCNTVKYNWKQARNMIADGCYGNVSGAWSFANGVSYVNDTSGYKSYRSFKLSQGTSINVVTAISQKLPKLIKNHKYYFSVYQKTIFDIATVAGILLRIKISSSTYTKQFATIYPHLSRNKWTLWSSLFEWDQDFTDSYSTLKIDLQSGSSSLTALARDIFLSKFILIDLTDTFGAGNEPTREWCDENIREHEVIVNYGCKSNYVAMSNLKSRYYVSSAENVGPFNYLELDSVWEPREYMYMLRGKTDKVEGYVYSQSQFALDNTKKYYAYIEYHKKYNDTTTGQSIDFYFPEAEPVLGNKPIVDNFNFNSGGGMWEWKRASVLNDRKSFNNGNYKLRVDFNNNNKNNELRLTAINLQTLDSNINIYNQYNNTSISEEDINKEWCDRWIDGRSSPIIHIKDPHNTDIKFNTGYDIICNDIEIRPELKEVKFDFETGTIYCSKLIKSMNY